ncbi:hypothetical protein TTHERM_00500760 (macronuclear) [Tetrahymena thermophila SB210]|uniref:Uncharacterized protein n=1 Tax=Tetrahymena thermophila (strain SB210) TaxID=312017 RepID=I7MLF3_TETTS|nr:hypothetical protein TTHERM_00500760 [Tetrahymena thermophila SB210]EAS01990.1 hypothetical protein TTHERM_00500760 [Tetrahymena thermophila SB210]|eukprot:XP_001022235.1 hypothetical protein TTHERM_00500760 [Tetrahymena thermophila SB210]
MSDFLKDIMAKVFEDQKKTVTDQILNIKTTPYNRLNLILILLKITLGDFVEVPPKEEYLHNQKVLQSIQEYFHKCIDSISLNLEEIELFHKFVDSLDTQENYIDKMIKDGEGFDYEHQQLGDIIKFCLDSFKSELYKENI